MTSIFPGRYTAQSDEPFVVFLIGFRVNRWLALRSWTRVAAAMGPMIAELKRQPELGLLHAETFMYWRGVGMVQYWRSFELLQAYAHARDAKHLPGFVELAEQIKAKGVDTIACTAVNDVFVMNAWGKHGNIYVNMPRFGLGGAMPFVPITGRNDSAQARMGRSGDEGSNAS